MLHRKDGERDVGSTSQSLEHRDAETLSLEFGRFDNGTELTMVTDENQSTTAQRDRNECFGFGGLRGLILDDDLEGCSGDDSLVPTNGVSDDEDITGPDSFNLELGDQSTVLALMVRNESTMVLKEALEYFK